LVTHETEILAARSLDERAYLALAAEHYENFPVGSWLVPSRLRRHVHRIYAFARTADDLADERQDADLLAACRASFADHLAGTRRSVPLFADLAASIRELGLPQALFFDLLDAFAEDLVVRRRDEPGLFAYCRKSADPVGRLVLRVFGHDDPALDGLSDRICTGLQLLNHLQDIRADLLERDRIYFPQEDLDRFGVTEADLAADAASPGVRALVRHWTDRTARLFAEGWPLTRAVRGRLALELRAIVGGAARVVGAIRRHDHDVLAAPIRLGRLAKAGVLARALCTARPPGALA
jgi:squalene synthase HpnC